MRVEQFVMAYEVEQDRLRAILPKGFASLRPVLRINAEIRSGGAQTLYGELNTPVEAEGKRGWLNIGCWDSTTTDLSYKRDGKAVTFTTGFLEITYTGTGLGGGCPAEKDNDGCFFLGENASFRPAENINSSKEFCDCSFSWRFTENDAGGRSIGKTLPAFSTEPRKAYAKEDFTVQNAAAIPCQQVLGSYVVTFQR